MSTARRLDRLEARTSGSPPPDQDQVDAELERLIEKIEREQGPGTADRVIAETLAEVEAEFAASQAR